MNYPLFKLQIVSAEEPHIVARFPGGGELEQDFIAACTKAIVKRGVGLMKTSAHVEADIAAGITDAIRALKHDSRFVR